MSETNAFRSSNGIRLHRRYGLLTLAYVVSIYWLSSLPDLGVRRDPVIRLVSNLFHIPLFAGLAFCLLQALSGREGKQQVTWRLLGLTFLVTTILAALDEWHDLEGLPDRRKEDRTLSVAGHHSPDLLHRRRPLRGRGPSL